MAAIIRNLIYSKSLQLFVTKVESSTVRYYASANRVKPFKKVGISNRARNEAKAKQMRAEAVALQEDEQAGSTVTGRRLESMGQSLATRGYLRNTKPYSPPEDVQSKLLQLAKSSNITNPKQKFASNQQKFEFLAACFDALKHSVPNSRLHEIQSVEDTAVFYQTPVDTTLPLDTLRNVEIPENLHIQHEYVRFHPETDTMFGGKSAFPKSSTVVTGLKYKDKYRGHTAKKSWP